MTRFWKKTEILSFFLTHVKLLQLMSLPVRNFVCQFEVCHERLCSGRQLLSCSLSGLKCVSELEKQSRRKTCASASVSCSVSSVSSSDSSLIHCLVLVGGRSFNHVVVEICLFINYETSD